MDKTYIGKLFNEQDGSRKAKITLGRVAVDKTFHSAARRSADELLATELADMRAYRLAEQAGLELWAEIRPGIRGCRVDVSAFTDSDRVQREGYTIGKDTSSPSTPEHPLYRGGKEKNG